MTELMILTAGDLYPAVRAVLTDDTGAPVDLTTAAGATFTLRRVGAASPLFTGTAAIVSPATSGVLDYSWSPGQTNVAGDYHGAFKVNYTIGGITYPAATGLRVRIQPSLATATVPAWAFCTPAEAAAVVGRDIAEADLFAAQGMIALLADATGAETTLTLRDADLLAKATAYQAVWVAANPDLLVAADVDYISQDGASAKFGHHDARLLGPMAQRCLNRLSWRRTLRSVQMTSDGVGEYEAEEA